MVPPKDNAGALLYSAALVGIGMTPSLVQVRALRPSLLKQLEESAANVDEYRAGPTRWRWGGSA
jgi:hypothetical protein